MNHFPKIILAVAVALALPIASAANDTLRRALEDELQRNMENLSLEDVAHPYFISYTVHDDHSTSVSGAYGGIKGSYEARSRAVQVEMRVGSPEMDNTNFISQHARNSVTRRALPLEDDYELIRKQIWLATDQAYKSAIGVYAAKEAALKNSDQEVFLDFSEEDPHVYVDTRSSQKINTKRVERAVRELSKLDKKESEISSHQITAFANQHIDTYINSEGSYFERVDDTAYIRATAWTQTLDGRYLTDYVNLIGRSWDEVADLRKAQNQIDAMYARLKESRKAPPLVSYFGPVLFEGQAAAEVIGQVLAPNLVNVKRPVFETEGVAASFNRVMMRSNFRERIGRRVLPRGINIYDDPSVSTYQSQQLVGQYPVDSDGLPTRRIQLVERGVLKTLLTDRNPTQTIQNSTASNATSAGPSVSNLFIEPTDGVERAELLELMFELADEQGLEYGLRIDYTATPFIQSSGVPSMYMMGQIGSLIPVIRAYKVYVDGSEELVRNVVISHNLLDEIRNLSGYSSTTSVHHGNYIFRGGDVSMFGGSFPVFTSISTPDLLFEGINIQYPTSVARSDSIVPHPQAN